MNLILLPFLYLINIFQILYKAATFSLKLKLVGKWVFIGVFFLIYRLCLETIGLVNYSQSQRYNISE